MVKLPIKRRNQLYCRSISVKIVNQFLSQLPIDMHHCVECTFLSLLSGHNVIVASIGGLFAVLGSLAIQLGAGGDHFPQIYHTRFVYI